MVFGEVNEMELVDFTDYLYWRRDARLKGADFSPADLYEADLSNADLRGPNLSRAVFIGAFLVGADFEGADLFNADFRRAVMAGAVNRTKTRNLEAALGVEVKTPKVEPVKQQKKPGSSRSRNSRWFTASGYSLACFSLIATQKRRDIPRHSR